MRTQETRPVGEQSASRKRPKAEERRIQLLKAAKELYSEYGFENTHVKAIAAEKYTRPQGR